MKNLDIVENKLKELARDENDAFEKCDYWVPDLWQDPYSETYGRIKINPCKYFIDKIEEIKNYSKKLNAVNTLTGSNIYNMMLRYTLSYDHDCDNKLLNKAGEFKETGTFLKAISLIPYLKSLDVNVVYLLPITSIGKAGQKGNAGSPYSVFDPYKLDKNLSEDVLGLSAEIQYAAFVEACHLAGIKVVNEFVFRTASIDTDLAVEHPDWFYWIKYTESGNYQVPSFSQDELKEIKYKINNQDFNNLITPSEKYKCLFTQTPKIVKKEAGETIGYLEDGTKCKIPCAFADWPPDDIQPVWSDVTYLKLYEHPDFNYIAYNTVRMYDSELEHEQYEVSDLWQRIINIIPYYQEKFGIDGVMIDMGHALPQKMRKLIVEKARNKNKDFILWEENFFITQKSKDEGYDAVVGYLPFDAHYCNKMKDFVSYISKNTLPINYFAMAESHNTPRVAGRFSDIEVSKMIWSYFPLLKYGLPLILSGFELGEKIPVNTGLGFDGMDLSQLSTDKLPLFSYVSLNWNCSQNIINAIRQIAEIKHEILQNNNDYEIIIPEYYNDFALCFIIKSKIINFDFLVVVNYLFEYENSIQIHIGNDYLNIEDLSGYHLNVNDGIIDLKLKPKDTKYLKLGS